MMELSEHTNVLNIISTMASVNALYCGRCPFPIGGNMHHVTRHLVTEKKGEVVGAMANVRVATSAASFEILEI